MSSDISANYREFHTEEEAEGWAWDNYADLLSIDTESELYKIISAYTGSWYKSLNELLRACPPIGTPEFNSVNFGVYEENKQALLAINDMLKHYCLKENIIVYRFTHVSCIIKMAHNMPRKGICFYDKAFVSTTLVKHLLKDFERDNHCTCLLKLFLPKGTPGAYVSFKQDKSLLNEQEFLLPPNIKMKITKAHYLKWPIQIDCTAILT